MGAVPGDVWQCRDFSEPVIAEFDGNTAVCTLCKAPLDDGSHEFIVNAKALRRNQGRLAFTGDPQGTTLGVDLEIKDGAWLPYVGSTPLFGRLSRIGVLPGGMVGGRPSAALLVILDDGRAVVAQTSWRNLALAAVALIGRWGTP
jgi:hypothetical protein